VQELAPDVLRHRVGLTYEAEAQDITPDTVIAQVLAATPVPSV
jgi:MoxR-like ATPase